MGLQKRQQKNPKPYFHENLKNAKNDTLSINLRLLQFWDNQCHLLIIRRTRWRSVAIILVHHWCKWDKCVVLKENFPYSIKTDSYENKVVALILILLTLIQILKNMYFLVSGFFCIQTWHVWFSDSPLCFYTWVFFVLFCNRCKKCFAAFCLVFFSLFCLFL